jgi:hypothetical protein
MQLPLAVSIGDSLQVPVSKDQVADAPRVDADRGTLGRRGG